MAKKRMFNLGVLETDAFLDMPLSTQALYFHLNLRADDDGFVGNPKRITTNIGASLDDLKLLIAKRFVLAFEDGVIVIKHWRMHNAIKKDRYTETNYTEDLLQLDIKENGAYTFRDGALLEHKRSTNGAQMEQTCSADKVRIEEVSKEKNIYTPTEADLKTEFDAVWKEYPRKEGKVNAERDYIKARKEGIEQQTILDGIRRYKAKLKAENTEMQFTMQGSTWFHQRRWTDEYEPGKKRNYAERSYTDYEEVYQ